MWSGIFEIVGVQIGDIFESIAKWWLCNKNHIALNMISSATLVLVEREKLHLFSTQRLVWHAGNLEEVIFDAEKVEAALPDNISAPDGSLHLPMRSQGESSDDDSMEMMELASGRRLHLMQCEHSEKCLKTEIEEQECVMTEEKWRKNEASLS